MASYTNSNRLGTLLVCTLFLLLASGCSSKYDKYMPKYLKKTPQPAPAEKAIRTPLLPIDPSTSRVCVFRFTEPAGLDNIGYTASDSFYRALANQSIFQEVVPKFDAPGITLSHQLNMARENGCNLIFTGNVRLYLDGTQYQESRVVIEANGYRVDTGENIWHVTESKTDQPILAKDYYLYKTKGKEPMSALTLIDMINENFMDMLKDATAGR